MAAALLRAAAHRKNAFVMGALVWIKAQAAIFLCLLLCTGAALAKVKSKPIIKTGDGGNPPASRTVTTSSGASSASVPFCGAACEWLDTSSPDMRARVFLPSLPYTPFPVFLTGRYTLRSFEDAPSWIPRYSSADWTVAGGLEVPLTSVMSLWGEVSRTMPTGVSGCAGCLVSGSLSNKYQSDIARAGFLFRY
jgi:hypothetical protein